MAKVLGGLLILHIKVSILPASIVPIRRRVYQLPFGVMSRDNIVDENASVFLSLWLRRSWVNAGPLRLERLIAEPNIICPLPSFVQNASHFSTRRERDFAWLQTDATHCYLQVIYIFLYLEYQYGLATLGDSYLDSIY